MPTTLHNDFKIQPDDISVVNHFFEAFGHTETEVSARMLVRMARARGKGWEPFDYATVNDFYQGVLRNENISFHFNRLIPCRFIVEEKGQYFFTDAFVENCYRSVNTP